MTINISFRAMQREDARVVIELLQEISLYRPSEGLQAQDWEDYSGQSNVHPLVACLDSGEVVGFGALVLEKKIRGGWLGHIEDIVTCGAYQRSGIGTRVVQELINLAKAMGCYKVVLNCKQETAPFYEQVGFEIAGAGMQKMIRDFT